MNSASYQFLVEDHLRMLHREAEAARTAALAQQASKARLDNRTGRSGVRFDFIRRLVTRLAAA